jgi:L-aspartate oxidase
MIRSSIDVVNNLISYGARFNCNEDGSLDFTREGAHSAERIIFHNDSTGREITQSLIREAKTRSNIRILEYTRLLDIIEKDNICIGAVIRNSDREIELVSAKKVVIATGGVGGLYKHSTNFRHLTGDGIAIACRHNVKLKDMTYVQIHPTTFYTEKEEDRRFLISESVRGEGAKLYDASGNRFVDELLPRDLLTKEIYKQMKKDGTRHVWEDMRTIPEEEIRSHFPNIMKQLKDNGYDVLKECIPVVPAQHYFMGGIWVDHHSLTSMKNLYAVGETACNGVHGKNRLASNSLLESLVFAKRAAGNMAKDIHDDEYVELPDIDITEYLNEEQLDAEYADIVRSKLQEDNNNVR